MALPLDPETLSWLQDGFNQDLAGNSPPEINTSGYGQPVPLPAPAPAPDETGDNQPLLAPAQPAVPAAPPVAPLATTLPVAPTGLTSGSVDTSASASRTGFKQPAYEQAASNSKGIAGAIQQDIAQGKLDDKAQTERAYSDANRSAEAAWGVADATGEVWDTQAAGERAKQKQASDMAIAEQMASDHAAAATEGYRARLEGDLATVRNMHINSGKLFADMDTGSKIGTAASLFVQGFLGARGIQVNAQQALNYWVERSVADQEARIRDGQQLAENDKMLWDMARSQSHDDTEARGRVNAYLTAQVQSDIQAQVAMSQSKLAKAAGDGQVAEIQKALGLQIASLTKAAHERFSGDAAKLVDLHGINSRAAIASAEIRSREKVAAAQLAAQPKAGKYDQLLKAGILFDAKENGGAPKWVFKPGVSSKTQELLATHNAVTQTFVHEIDKLRELTDAASVYDQYNGIGSWIAAPENRLQLQSMHAKMLNTIKKENTGMAANTAEIESFLKQLPYESLLSGDTDSTLAQFKAVKLAETSDNISNFTMDIPENVQQELVAAGYSAAKQDFMAPQKLAAEVQAKNAPRENTIVGDAVDRLQTALISDDDSSGKMSPLWAKTQTYDAKGESVTKEPQWGKEMDGLARLAVGDKGIRELDPNSDREAYGALRAIEEEVVKNEKNPEARIYARDLLNEVDRQREASGQPKIDIMYTDLLGDWSRWSGKEERARKSQYYKEHPGTAPVDTTGEPSTPTVSDVAGDGTD